MKKVLTQTPHQVQKENGLLGHVYGLSSLSLNPNVINAGLNLQNLLTKNPLRKHKNLIIWHDVLNNSITPHTSNRKTPLSVDELKKVLNKHQKRITAIVVNQRIGAPDLFETLCELGIATVISVTRHLISYNKKKSPYYIHQLKQIHPSTHIELNLINTVLRHQDNLPKLTLKYRSQTRKRSGKKPSYQIKRAKYNARKKLQADKLKEQIAGAEAADK